MPREQRWSGEHYESKRWRELRRRSLFGYSSGIVREGESYLVGPLLDGTFLPCKVTTIQRYRVPRRLVRAGQAATLSLSQIEDSRLRKVSDLRTSESAGLICLGNGVGLFDIESSSVCGVRC